MARRRRTIVTLTVLMLFGVGVFAYPFAATWFNQVVIANKVNSYAEAVEGADLEAVMEAARRYNREMLPIPIGDPYSMYVDSSDLDYYQMLVVPGTDAIGRVLVPSINVDIPIYHGTSDEVLRRGAGHLYGTSLPIGGEGTHSSISAHTGMADARFFDRLVEVAEADMVYIKVLDQTLAYQVDSVRVVTPEEGAHMVKREAGKDLLTLITCTPYGVNSHRLMVTGHRVPFIPAEEVEEVASQPGFPWWAIPTGLVVVGTVAVSARMYRRAGRSVVDHSTVEKGRSEGAADAEIATAESVVEGKGDIPRVFPSRRSLR